MLELSSFRDRITEYCYLGTRPDDAMSQLERAMQLLPEVENIDKKYQAALRDNLLPRHGTAREKVQAAVDAKILTSEEGQSLAEFAELRDEVIAVDEFALAKVLQIADAKKRA